MFVDVVHSCGHLLAVEGGGSPLALFCPLSSLCFVLDAVVVDSLVSFSYFVAMPCSTRRCPLSCLPSLSTPLLLPPIREDKI